jgi:hypothetical protein
MELEENTKKKGKTQQRIKKTHLEYGILAAKALDLNQITRSKFHSMEGKEGDPDPRDRILDHHQTMDRREFNPANKNTSQLVIKRTSTIAREKEEVRQ